MKCLFCTNKGVYIHSDTFSSAVWTLRHVVYAGLEIWGVVWKFSENLPKFPKF